MALSASPILLADNTLRDFELLRTEGIGKIIYIETD